MKINFKSISIITSLFALFVLTNCGQKDHHDHENHDEGSTHEHEAVEESKANLGVNPSDYKVDLEGTSGILETYYFLKDALVATNADVAKKAAKLL
nr:DUF3347 domain-containing protein [Flammeovirgaceae bacterium]